MARGKCPPVPHGRPSNGVPLTNSKSKVSVSQSKSAGRLAASRSIKQSLGKLRARLERLEICQIEPTDLKEELAACAVQQRRVLKAIADEGLPVTTFLSWLEAIDESKLRLRRAQRRTSHDAGKPAVSKRDVAVISPPAIIDPQPVLDEINRLYLRLTGLRASLRQNSIPNAEKELKKCHVHGANIGEMIKSKRLEVSYFFTQFQGIHELVIDIEDDIARMKNVWWRQALQFLGRNLGKFIPSVAKIFGVPVPSLKLLSYDPKA